MDRSQRVPRRPTVSSMPMPAITKARIILQRCKIRIELDKFASDPLDHRAYIGAVALLAVAGNKAIAANDIIDLAISDVAACTVSQQCDHVELVTAERDMATTPSCAFRRLRQNQLAEL